MKVTLSSLIEYFEVPMSSQPPAELPSNRKFGWLFTAIFSGLSAWLIFLSAHHIWALVFIALALVFALLTAVSPKLLTPLNFAWHKLGLLLGQIISPIVLGLIFFALITPVSLVTRLFGRDELKIKKRAAETYWIDRSPPGPSSESFKNQY